MVNTQLQLDFAENESNFDREKELQAFDESKAGVKGLVDAGVVKIPPFFVVPGNQGSPDRQASEFSKTQLQIPVIDMKDMNGDPVQHNGIVDQIRFASETWGFFQVVNHEISEDVMEEMIEGVRRFHEQPRELKKEYYSRDLNVKVKYNSNYDLYKTKSVNWRDTFYFDMTPDAPSPEEFPEVCRDITIKFSAGVRALALTLFELLSEALGLEPNHLLDIECAKGLSILGHYYPACPEPDRTLGTTAHKDPSFITMVMQDHIGGLQVFHQNQWVDIPPIPGAFVVIGDLYSLLEQLISNGKFKSAKHRVLAKGIGPGISVTCFFATYFPKLNRLYGPTKELLSEENPPSYKDVRVADFTAYYTSRGTDGDSSALDYFRL